MEASDAEISAPRAKRGEKSSTLLHGQFLKYSKNKIKIK